MRYLHITSPGNIELRRGEIPKANKPDERLIKVVAAGLNRIDLLIIDGTFKLNKEIITPGLEIFGYDVETNEAFMALVPYGGFSEYLIVKKDLLIPAQYNLQQYEYAALPEGLAVAQQVLLPFLKKEELRPILIHGGSSGIGSFLTSIAHLLQARVVTTVGDDYKKQFCLKAGASQAINYKCEEYDKLCQQDGGAYLAVDILGADYFAKTLDAIAVGGRINLLAVMNNSKAEVNLAKILMKNIAIEGFTIKDKSDHFKKRLIEDALAHLGPLIKGLIIPIDSIHSIEDYAEAFSRMKNRQNLGKIVLTF